MALKPRYKRRIAWGVVSALAAMVLAIVIVPPFVRLNYLKPKIEDVIARQTGYNAKIYGDVHFSLVGGVTLVAHNVRVANGTVDRVSFRIPAAKIMDIDTAPLAGNIGVYGANIAIDNLVPPKFNNKIEIRNSVINFLNKNYIISGGTLSDGLLTGTVRTDQHKYEFDSNGDEFNIRNKNNNLEINGLLYSDGTAHGTLSIDTTNVNTFFEFSEPKIRGRVKMKMTVDWDGGYGLRFSDIHGDDFTGHIELFDDGRRDITLKSDNANFDFSFLLSRTGVFYNTRFNLDLYGNLRFADKTFRHLKLDAVGTTSEIKINNVIADDIIITGGIIGPNGAIGMPISMPFDGVQSFCLFSGTPDSWGCTEFVHGNLRGSLSVRNNTFEIFVHGDGKMPDAAELATRAKLLGRRGVINFQFSDIAGSIEINDTKSVPKYIFAKNKTLEWMGSDLYFIPEFMRTTTGDFSWNEYGMTFTPHSKRWTLDIAKNYFMLSGKNARDWFPGLDLQSVNDFEYTVSGNIDRRNISNLEIRIAGHLFTGRATDNNVTLMTDLLNIDTFANQKFIDNFDELQFLTAEPLTLPFSIPANISLSAGRLIYNGDEFANFIYTLKPNSQSFSITDTARGNLLATITREQNKYKISVQLNRFVTFGGLLSRNAPINVSDTTITGEARLSTSGQIAYDIWYNLNGDLDLTFTGGKIIGLGTDDFYAGSKNATKTNAEFMLAAALDGGASALKTMRLVGKYDGGNFTTTTPFSLSLRHVDAIGTLRITDGMVSGNMNMILRGTSPAPAPISMEILPSGRRNYSLSQIMIDFDPDFFRDFVSTHDRF